MVTCGIGCLVVRPDGRFLIGKRKGSHGAGTYAVPGGLLEFGESWGDCASRELLEECAIKATGTWRPTFLCNALFKKEGKHHVGIFMITHVEENVEPKLCEPDKCHGWDWYSMEELLNFKDKKFLTLQKLCDAYEEKKWTFATVLSSFT